MRILGFLLAILVSTFVFAPGENSFADDAAPKIGVVDIARLMRDSVPGKEGVKFIESQQAAMQKKLDEIQAKLEKDPKNEELMRELQRVYASAQQKIQAEGQNVANLIFDAVQRVINKYRQDNGYLILAGSDAVASYDPAIDVTKAVLAEVDKEKIEFKPLPEPPAPKVEEGADAKKAEPKKDAAPQKADKPAK